MANELPFPEPQAPAKQEAPASQPQAPAPTQQAPAQTAVPSQQVPMSMMSGNFAVGLPEDWGGRPVGNTRRALRKQKEWDDQQAAMLQMAEFQRKAQAEARNAARLEAQESREQAKYEAAQDIEFQTEKESNNILAWLTGKATDNQGNPIPKPNPQDPNFGNQLNAVISYNRLGYEAVQDVVGRYADAHTKYMDGLVEQKKFEREQAERAATKKEDFSKEMQKVAEISERSGLPMSQFVTTDPITGMDVINREALGRAEGKLQVKPTEEKPPKVAGLTPDDLNKTITGIQADLAEAKGADDANKVQGLQAKLEYYQGLLPSQTNTKNVAPTDQSQYSSLPPVKDRKTGSIYPTPMGDMKWTGKDWVKP